MSFALNAFKTILRRSPKPNVKPFNFALNQYPAHSRWPPVFEALEERDQFRLERKFRRRSKLKWARPVWNRNISLFQWGASLFILTYVLFFVDYSGETPNEKTPQFLMGFRDWYSNLVRSFWSNHSSEKSRGEDLYQQRHKEVEDALNALDASPTSRAT